MSSPQPAFRMGRLDHVHIRVPNRNEATGWYATHLGIERVQAFDFWAHGFDGGPLQISADGGNTTLTHVSSFGSNGYRTRARGSQRGAVQAVHDASPRVEPSVSVSPR